MKKKLGTYFILLCLSFILLIVFTFLYPGKIVPFDNFRVKLQVPIVQTLTNFNIRNSDISNKTISYVELNKYLQTLETATIIFTHSSDFFSNVFINGYWKHIAIFLGTKMQVEEKFGQDSNIYSALTPYYKNPNDVLILDSSSKGVLIRNFKELSNLHSNSYLRSLVCFNIQAAKSEIQTFVRVAVNQIGKAYDYDLRADDNSSIYCSELISTCLDSIGIKVDVGSHFFGRTYISPTDMFSYISRKGIAVNEFSFQLLLNKENGVIKQQYKDKQ